MELKFSKFDNTPWGFRLHGGIDYGTPLTVVKVKGGSLADKAGLQVHDQLLKINDALMTNVNHEQAHNIILSAGNNFVITIYRPGSKSATPCFEDLSTESLIGIPQKQLQPLCPSQVVKDKPSQQTSLIVKSPSVTKSVQTFQESIVKKSEFQTIKQLEWKEVAPKFCPKRQCEDNIIGKGTKIDLLEIEKSAVEQAKNVVEIGINKIKAKDIERPKSVDYLNPKDPVVKRAKSVSFLDDNEETVIEERCKSVREITQQIEETIRHEKESIQHIEKKNERIWWVGTVKQNELKITEQPTPEEIVEQKMERVCVKDLTQKHEQVTLEQAQSCAIKAAKVLSQQTKSGNLTVPCIVSNVNTSIQTDTLLKTFFIHLTDVMVALNQMIAKDEGGSCQCGPKCQCIQNYLQSQKQTSSETCQQMSELIKQFSSSSEKIEAKTEKRRSSIVQKIDVKVETPEKPPDGMKRSPSNEEISSEAKHVIKEVMKETLGVDVTINGKDALEWIADIEQNKIDIEEIKTSEIFNAAETVVKKVVEEIESQVKVEEIEKVKIEEIDNRVQIEEVQTITEQSSASEDVQVQQKEQVIIEEIKSEPIVEEPQNIISEQIAVQTISNITSKQEISSFMSCEEKVEVISSSSSTTTTSEQTVVQSAQQSAVVESEVKKPESPKAQSPVGIDPATPTAYVFRLDVKWKGKLAPAPEKTEEPAKAVEEPSVREDLSIVRRPTFYLGDVTIETLTSAQEGAEEKPPIRPTTLDLTSVSTKKEATNLLTNEIASAVTTNISETLTKSRAEEMTESQTAIPVPLSPKALASQHDLSAGDATFASASASLHDTKQQSQELKMTEIKEISEAAEIVEVNAVEEDKKEAISSTEQIKMAEVKSVVEEQILKKSVEENETTKVIEKSEIINDSKTIDSFQDFNNNSVENVEEVCAIQAKTKEAAEKIYATIETRRTSQNIDQNENYNLQINDKPGLTDDEIAGIISGEAEILKDQHVLGLKRVLASHMARDIDEDNDPFSVDFNKMKPQLEFIRHSEVFKALNEDAIKARADLMHEQRKSTTFLQKPNRPIPFCRKIVEQQALQNQYKVVIKRQSQRDSEDFGPGILTEGVFLVPEVPILIPEPSPVFLEAPEYLPDSEYPDLEDTGIPLPPEPQESEPEDQENYEEETTEEHQEEEDQADLESEEVGLDQVDWVNGVMDDLELPVEDQLAKVQKQLEALAKLPAAIQQTLETVTKQLTKMVPKTEQTQNVKVEESATDAEETKQAQKAEETTEAQKESKEEEQKVEQVTTTVIEEKKTEETVIVKEEKHTIKTEEICSFNQEQKMNKLRKIRHWNSIWPWCKQVQCRMYRESNCPFVAMLKEGRLLHIRVNFMKYKKPPVNMDLIKNSPVYKMVHDMEPPSHPIEEREPICFAECDYREKCRSVTPSSMMISSR